MLHYVSEDDINLPEIYERRSRIMTSNYEGLPRMMTIRQTAKELNFPEYAIRQLVSPFH